MRLSGAYQTQTGVHVVVSGARGSRGFPSGPLGAGSVGAEEITNDAGELAALREKIGATGSVRNLTGDLTLESYTALPADGFNLNGFTLTIENMTDTGVTNLFRGAGTVTIRSGFARPEWWSSGRYTDAMLALHRGGGGVVQCLPLRYGREGSDVTPIAVQNVTLRGAGLPVFAAGFSTLAGGTIIEGPLAYASNTVGDVTYGRNCAVENLGVDSGSAVCAAAGLDDIEGITFANIGQAPDGTVPLREGIRIENVRVLCQDATALNHCILVEQATHALVRNVETVYGSNGIVFKARNSICDGAYMRGHAVNCWIDKSDSYAISQYNTWRNLRMGSITGRDTFGGRIQCGSFTSVGHRVQGCVGTVLSGAVLSIEPGGYFAVDIQLSDIAGDDVRFYGITLGGNTQRVSMTNIRMANVIDVADGTQGNGISIGAGADQISIAGFSSIQTAGDGIRSSGTRVVVSAAMAVSPGAGRFGFNAPAGDMKMAAYNGTINGNINL